MNSDIFNGVPEAPADPILGLNASFAADTDPRKVNLGVGAYRDNSGKPLVLQVVRQMEQQLASDASQTHEYLPIEGLAEFRRETAKLILGADAVPLKEDRVAVVQTLSGTGALRVGFEFIAQHLSPKTPVWISDPTWANHHGVVRSAGLDFMLYPYWDGKTRGLDFTGMTAALRTATPGSVILLHPCAHNPTGVDPTPEQWAALADLCAERKLVPFFDTAYQGFATGDLQADAHAVRHFLARGFEMFVTQSYAKNFGLYGERVGALSVVCSNKARASAVLSQLKRIIRVNYSNPPKHGAAIVSRVLADPKLFALWDHEMRGMANRIKAMRSALLARLKENGCPGTWTHITDQIGMFSYTGLNEKQCTILTEKWHIYLVKNGRISMAGVNDSNVAYIADAIKDAVVSAQ